MIKITGLILNIDPAFVDYRLLESGGEIMFRNWSVKWPLLKVQNTPIVKCSQHAKFESQRAIAAMKELSLYFMYKNIYTLYV